jgi:hypothetical protein
MDLLFLSPYYEPKFYVLLFFPDIHIFKYVQLYYAPLVDYLVLF